jgi:O-antigen/teichoic acid export membrane protein
VYLFLGINVFVFISKILANNIHLSKNSKFDTITETTAGVLNLILNFIFIYYFGFIGAIYATLITYFIRFAMYDFFAKRLFYKYKISLMYYFYYLTTTFLIFFVSNYIQTEIQFTSKILIYIMLICFGLLFFYFNLNTLNQIKLKVSIVKKFQGQSNAKY